MYSAADHAQGLSSGVPLLLRDMYEHSYHVDYGTAAATYIDAVLANLHWEEIDRRTAVALRIAEAHGCAAASIADRDARPVPSPSMEERVQLGEWLCVRARRDEGRRGSKPRRLGLTFAQVGSRRRR